jgi:hypothetical protein
MSQREIIKQSAAQEAAQWDEEEEQQSLESLNVLSDQLSEMNQQMKELDARQARIENHLIKFLPSAKKAEQQFATIVLAGKELREEMAEHHKNIATTLTQYRKQVTITAGEIKDEFQHQLQILQVFFDETLKISEKNEQMVGQCQDMVATSSAVYHKGSAGVLEISEKTQAHLKSAAEAHRKEIEAQAQHFKATSKQLGKWVIIGTVVILLSALIAGTMAGLMIVRYRQLQEKEDTSSQTR